MISQKYRPLADDIIRFALKIRERGCQMGDGGNLSIRAGEGLMLVKGTNVAFDEIAPENLVLTDLDGNVIEGDIRPSKEALLHGAIYRAVPGAGAIMHCHSPYATAWASGHDALEFSTHHSAMKLSGRVPVFDTHSYAVPKEFLPEILGFFKETPEAKAFLLRAHGQVTVGRDMRAAAYLAELVEETAMISILSRF